MEVGTDRVQVVGLFHGHRAVGGMINGSYTGNWAISTIIGRPGAGEDGRAVRISNESRGRRGCKSGSGSRIYFEPRFVENLWSRTIT